MSTLFLRDGDDAEDDPFERQIEGAGYIEEGLAGLTTDWSVPWSDLTMVLFILFVVLYCYEKAERAVPDAFPTPGLLPDTRTAPAFVEPAFEPATRERLVQQSRDLVAIADPEDVELVLGEDDTVRVSVRGESFFDLGKADLRPETQRFLDRLAPILRNNAYEVRVVGHTDSFPIHSAEFPTNWELSALRATRIARYLIERGQLEPGRFTVVGHSMYRPAAPDTSLSHKARNRRVEIIVTRDVYTGEFVGGQP